MTSDHTIGTAPNSRMIAAAGVTKLQPTIDSERARRAPCLRRPPRTDVAGGPWPPATVLTATSSARAGQDRVHLRRRLAERGLRLRLAEQDRHDHRAEY